MTLSNNSCKFLFVRNDAIDTVCTNRATKHVIRRTLKLTGANTVTRFLFYITRKHWVLENMCKEYRFQDASYDQSS